MKIERLNDKQIRCTLTKEDLESRSINLSELAYGSKKAKQLFTDMMQQAADDLGFHVDDIPLMIEAIPLPHESIALIISKVDSPDELDTRFSNFTKQLNFDDIDDDTFDHAADDDDSEYTPDDAAGDFLDIMDKLRAKHNEAADSDKRTATQKAMSRKTSPAATVRIYSFTELDLAIQLARQVKDFYTGENTLYKAPNDDSYRLTLRQGPLSDSDYHRVCHAAAQLLTPEKTAPNTESYYKEHFHILLPEHALQMLSEV